ncbi:hypothetical protein [Arthrobacter sp. ISL-69]|uniref:hypothetical protein n=1 Tax=Arthrobacter sp. ISL-69 TaxID=2819113 RepID=UPI001BE765D2|nr:hypothetical protein [Arthrobacter sp. ISL-69]MBT2538926.1 hypothetical protein [Arthrobacter sp. ISL-69]
MALTMVGVSLAGCAAPDTGPLSGTGTPSQSPTAACPRVDEMPDPQQCAAYDPDAAMRENERYREQRTISAQTRALLAAYVEPARTALESLQQPATVADVRKALESVGIDEREVQTDDVGIGIRFGAAANGGCLTGFVSQDGTATISTGGAILDGGCLAMSGH